MRPPSEIGDHVLAELVETARRSPPGAIVEVGVYRGGSAWHLAQVAREQERLLYLYDTFRGMPHRDAAVDPHHIGDFANTTADEVQEAIPEAYIIAGVFPDSAVHMGPIGFVHLDCDQYLSVKQSILYLVPRMMLGGIIWFDDYDCLPGAKKAVDECFTRLTLARCGKSYAVIGEST